MVSPQPRRHHPTRRKPTEEVRGHLSVRFRVPGLARLWVALLGVVRFWIDQGVRIFRVDNPHTKPFAFWEWLIACVRADVPEVFLSRGLHPAASHGAPGPDRLQPVVHLLHMAHIQVGARDLPQRADGPARRRTSVRTCGPIRLTSSRGSWSRAVGAFLARLVLAATLSASYGIYGPVFELQEHIARQPGSEEYLRSEKYEIRSWDLGSPTSLAEFVASLNLIRREHEALQFNDSLRFHGTDNDALIAYSKARVDRPNGSELDVVLVVVNLDHRHAQTGWVTVDLRALGFVENLPYVARDLLTGAHYVWRGRPISVSPRPRRRPVPCLRAHPAGRLARGCSMTTTEVAHERRTAALAPLGGSADWYKEAVIYELHVRAFHDGNGDGIGDFKGLIEKLDYLQGLGVTAIWLLPFYPSPFGTTATTSPTTGRSTPRTGPSATSASSCARPIDEVSASSPSSCSRTPPTPTRGSSGPGGPAPVPATGTTTCGVTRRSATPRRG